MLVVSGFPSHEHLTSNGSNSTPTAAAAAAPVLVVWETSRLEDCEGIAVVLKLSQKLYVEIV